MNSKYRSKTLSESRRVVVKIGSSLLIDPDSGKINDQRLLSICNGVMRLRSRNQQVVIVSSGAIALGRRRLDLSPAQNRLDHHQSAAATGQIILVNAYSAILGHHEISVAQILLTLEDTEDRKRYLNARATLENLLDLNAIPIVNENDTVATDEIKYGDNDRLAARVAQMISADCLILLSDVSGLYSADPDRDDSARLIPVVQKLTPDIEAIAGESRTEFGTGGMRTKVEAAKICVQSGCATVIASGKAEDPIGAIEAGAPCTWFLPTTSPRVARKQWIAGTLTPKGTLQIDEGAAVALESGRSLLAVGIARIEGEFDRGDLVSLQLANGEDIARGLVAYSSAELQLIKGKHSDQTEGILGYRGRQAVVHRDNMALIK